MMLTIKMLMLETATPTGSVVGVVQNTSSKIFSKVPSAMPALLF